MHYISINWTKWLDYFNTIYLRQNKDSYCVYYYISDTLDNGKFGCQTSVRRVYV